MSSTERIRDQSDLATAFEETFTRAALSVRKPEGPKAIGHCLNCETPLPKGMRWCDADCRHDWELLGKKEDAAGDDE